MGQRVRSHLPDRSPIFTSRARDSVAYKAVIASSWSVSFASGQARTVGHRCHPLVTLTLSDCDCFSIGAQALWLDSPPMRNGGLGGTWRQGVVAFVWFPLSLARLDAEYHGKI